MTVLRYALILALVFLPASLFATTFPVTKTADTDDGTCDPDCSLREAIDAANANPGADDVPVPAGTYLLTLGQLVVSDEVSIAGAGQETTIIDGNAADRLFDIDATSGVVAISGVTIQNGHVSSLSDDNGGGIRNLADLSLTDSTVSGNFAGNGGGGIYSRGILKLTNSTVSGNTAVYIGGGILGSDMFINNSTVSGNTVPGNNIYGGRGLGGGIAVEGDYSYYADTFLTNSTVSGNYAYTSGGGIIFRGDSRLSIINSTVAGNTTYYGKAPSGGIGRVSSGNSSIEVFGTIVANNSPGNCGYPRGSGPWSWSSHGFNLTDDDSCSPSPEPTDLVVADAMLGPLQDNGGPTETHDLLPGSPAIDAGSVDCPPPDTDQRGVTRPQGAACDIGAVEYLPEPRGPLTLIAGAAFLALLYRRRARGLRLS
jgi:CSLREA domain-containing protein